MSKTTLTKLLSPVQYHGTALTPSIKAQIAKGKIEHLPDRPYFWATQDRSIAQIYAKRAAKYTDCPAVLLTIATTQKAKLLEESSIEGACEYRPTFSYPALRTDAQEPIFITGVSPLTEANERKIKRINLLSLIAKGALTGVALAYLYRK